VKRQDALASLVALALAVALGLFIQQRLRISGDLRLFMPAPHSAAERLLLDEVSTGPAARLLLVALRGAPPGQLAQSSQQLAAGLRRDPAFRLVTNGENRLDIVPDRLLPYRYLLSPTLDSQRLDADFLRDQLAAREQDLASPAGSLLAPLLPRDPSLELLQVLQSWQPAQQAQTQYDVWFNARGDAALLLVETAAAGFDPRGQRAAIDALRAHFARARTTPATTLEVTGPGAFAVLMQARSERDANLAGLLDTVGMVILMLLAYRRLRFVVLGALPLAAAGIAGLTAVTLVSGTVHGITIAFGFTLIGVALDYPIYLFSNQRPGESPWTTLRTVWPTLATAVLAIGIAYLAFLGSGVAGLAQLACFNVAGLATACLCTRWLLPRWMPAGARDYGELPLVAKLADRTARLPRLPWLPWALAAVSLAAFVFVPGPHWDNDLGHLTPVPEQLLREYSDMQRELGSPDVRWLLAIDGSSADDVLTREQQLTPRLEALVDKKEIAGFDFAARYLPDIATQKRRQAALPDTPTLRAALAKATAGMAFRAGLFEPFLADVASARTLPPLTPQNVAGTPLELTVGGLLMPRDGHWTGLVTFTGINDPARLAPLARALPGQATLLDLKQAADDLVAGQRRRIVWCVLAAAVLLVIVVATVLRSPRRALRAVTPMLLAALMTLGILHACGVALNLFHIIALVLAAGLGTDYGLFFERASHDPAARRRTLHALMVCAAAACVVFSVLASSPLPVLRAIGITVVLGVAGNFILSLLLIRPQATADHAP